MDNESAYQGSAIDDSFFPNHATPISPTIPEHDFQFNSQVTGPRSGHWTVLSTANGSTIDDRVPTVQGLHSRSLSDAGASARVQRVDGNALRKLAAATEKARRDKEDEGKSRGYGSMANEETKQQIQSKAEKEKKGFYIPKSQDGRGIRIRARDGKDEVVKQSTPRSTSSVSKPHNKTEVKRKMTGAASTSSAPASERSASVASATSRRTTNLVRIVSKSGEESFVELPCLPQASRSVSTSQYKIRSPQQPAGTDVAKEKEKQDAAAEREAKRLRDERLAADAMEKQKRDAAAEKEAERLREKRIAAETMMHGALPARSITSSVARSAKPAKSSSNVSEQKTPRVFDIVSKPVSVASTNTSVAKTANSRDTTPQWLYANSSKATSKQPSVASWHEVGSGIYEPASSNKDKTRSPRDATKPLPKAATQRSAYTDHSPTPNIAAVSKPISFRYSYRHSSNTQRLPATQNEPSEEHAQTALIPEQTESQTSSASTDSFPLAVPVASDRSSSNPWQQSDIGIRTDMQRPTVFAGRGWISPHPLSEASSYARGGPDPVIQLPSGAAIRTESGPEAITYEEWLAVQNGSHSVVGSLPASADVRANLRSGQSRSQAAAEVVREILERRNISITESHSTRQYAGGRWGFREGEPSGQGRSRSPTAKTGDAVGHGRQTASLQSNVVNNAPTALSVGDEEGNKKTWLEMPWDDRAGKEAGSRKGNSFQGWF